MVIGKFILLFLVIFGVLKLKCLWVISFFVVVELGVLFIDIYINGID